MAQSLISPCISFFAAADANSRPIRPLHRFSSPKLSVAGDTSFRGTPLLVLQTSSPRKTALKVTLVSIRCEQGAKEGGSLGIWLGRLAMVGFAAAITVEISTGRGLLENFGLSTPVPTVALVVTAVVVVLTAFFIFQSASSD